MFFGVPQESHHISFHYPLSLGKYGGTPHAPGPAEKTAIGSWLEDDAEGEEKDGS